MKGMKAPGLKKIGSAMIKTKQPKPMSLKASEGFTGYKPGSSKVRLTGSKAMSNKGKAMVDKTAASGMTGYKTKGTQAKAARQGAYNKNLKTFLGGN